MKVSGLRKEARGRVVQFPGIGRAALALGRSENHVRQVLLKKRTSVTLMAQIREQFPELLKK